MSPTQAKGGAMRRIGAHFTLFTCWAFFLLAFEGMAVAQTADLYDCSDFDTQEEAQAQLLPGDPYGLDGDNDGMACDTLPSGGTTSGGSPVGGGGGRDLDCADFANQEDAQAVLETGSLTASTSPLSRKPRRGASATRSIPTTWTRMETGWPARPIPMAPAAV